MKVANIPEQCRICLNFNHEEQLCKIHEQLPGEYGREDVKECPSYLGDNKDEELKALALYIDQDPDQIVEQHLQRVVNKIVNGYGEKFKIMVIGVARRKIKAMIKMVDVIDILLDKLTDRTELDNMNANQSIRLLSELNNSINTDLSFIMKLVNPDTQLRDLQLWIDARTINENGASPATEVKAEEILRMTGSSRDKIRDAFDALLNNIPDDSSYVEVREESKEDTESL